MHYYTDVLKKYVAFDGRAARKEFWMFVLWNFIISLAIAIVGGVLLSANVSSTVSSLYSLAVLLPSLAVSVRRLHDTGRSGWWLLIGLIPVVGWVVLLIFMVLDSTPGQNEYGPNPKGMMGDSAQMPSQTPQMG